MRVTFKKLALVLSGTVTDEEESWRIPLASSFATMTISDRLRSPILGELAVGGEDNRGIQW